MVWEFEGIVRGSRLRVNEETRGRIRAEGEVEEPKNGLGAVTYHEHQISQTQRVMHPKSTHTFHDVIQSMSRSAAQLLVPVHAGSGVQPFSPCTMHILPVSAAQLATTIDRGPNRGYLSQIY